MFRNSDEDDHNDSDDVDIFVGANATQTIEGGKQV